MGRIIHTQSPAQIRNYHRRTIAELLRHLSQKPQVDEETKDMAALLVYSLREIGQVNERAAQAWERRDYWLKADRFRREWAWVGQMAEDLEDVLRHQAWDLLPRLLMDLLPRFADIKVTRLTRSPELWRGAYERLVNGSTEPPHE
ncbi:MAG: hypothetical protein D6759_08610 [Chloroflexi bacterium]|nr:MAG: hypothetical protein D6759_08610 [Chloroflexota bacterium]